MVEVSELRSLPLFTELPDDQLAWFISQAQEITVKPDETYLRQGDPADAMFVFLEGQFEMRGDWGGQLITIPLKRDDVGGVLPFSRMKQYPVTSRAVTSGRILRFPASLFPELVQKMPELTSRLVARMSDRIREATKFQEQRDRLAALGKLSAGLAHELNNPASAAKRAASQLRALMHQIKEASHALGAQDLTSAQKAAIEKLEKSLIQRDDPPPNTLTMSSL